MSPISGSEDLPHDPPAFCDALSSAPLRMSYNMLNIYIGGGGLILSNLERWKLSTFAIAREILALRSRVDIADSAENYANNLIKIPLRARI